MNLDKTQGWKALQAHKKEFKDIHLRDELGKRQDNPKKYRIALDGLTLDFKHNIFNRETLSLLIDLAKEQDLEAWIQKLFSGETVNNTENRAAMHMALRSLKKAKLNVNGKNVVPDVERVRQRIYSFAKDIRTGILCGRTGKQFTDIVNIGIGGSYLGPEMVCKALCNDTTNALNIHFLANIDGHAAQMLFNNIDPETTLFIVASKSFTTQETLMNAHTARNWIVEHLGEQAVNDHFCAVSTNQTAVTEFGIDEDRMFPFWDWVGGRFSLWSSIGLPICIAIGIENFEELLDGAARMDKHFQTASFDKNIPVLMALFSVWYRNFWDAHGHAILPYDQRLERFPAYLQQLDMESNGKSVNRDGKPIKYDTGPIIFGEPGTNGQHAFYQLIHQGTEFISSDFIAAKHPDHEFYDHHTTLLANMKAQAEALAIGQTLEEAQNDQQKVFDGNRPSNIILLEKMTPFNLGMLVAAYEHKIFVQAALWNINCFDQWGVELGKTIANGILDNVSSQNQDNPEAKLNTLLSML